MKSYKELLKEKEELEKKLEDARKNELASAIAQAKSIIDEYKLTAEDLGFIIPKQAKQKSEPKEVIVKFRNPEKPSETWHGGRGAKPKWLKTYLDQGRKLEEFAV